MGIDAQKGNSYLLKVADKYDGTDYTTVGAMKTTAMTLTNTSVDITNKDSGGWQELLAGGGGMFTTRGEASSTRKPVEILGGGDNPVPTALMAALPLEQENMRKAINIDTALQESNASNSLFLMFKQQQALVGNEHLFLNMRIAMKRIGERLLEAIPLVYFADPTRLLRILKNSEDKEQFMDVTEEEIKRVIETKDAQKYDLVVQESPHSKTQKQVSLQVLFAMTQNGVGDPTLISDLIMQLSDFSHSGKTKQIIDDFKAAQATKMTPSEADVVKTIDDDEYKKSKIEGIPPAIPGNLEGGQA